MHTCMSHVLDISPYDEYEPLHIENENDCHV